MFDAHVINDADEETEEEALLKLDKKHIRTGLSYSDVAFLDAWEDEINWNRHEALMSNVEYFEQK